MKNATFCVAFTFRLYTVSTIHSMNNSMLVSFYPNHGLLNILLHKSHGHNGDLSQLLWVVQIVTQMQERQLKIFGQMAI